MTIYGYVRVSAKDQNEDNYSVTVEKDNDLYRVSNTSLTNVNGRPENVAMLNGYYGTTWWFSVINTNTAVVKHFCNTYG